MVKPCCSKAMSPATVTAGTRRAVRRGSPRLHRLTGTLAPGSPSSSASSWWSSWKRSGRLVAATLEVGLHPDRRQQGGGLARDALQVGAQHRVLRGEHPLDPGLQGDLARRRPWPAGSGRSGAGGGRLRRGRPRRAASLRSKAASSATLGTQSRGSSALSGARASTVQSSQSRPGSERQAVISPQASASAVAASVGVWASCSCEVTRKRPTGEMAAADERQHHPHQPLFQDGAARQIDAAVDDHHPLGVEAVAHDGVAAPPC